MVVYYHRKMTRCTKREKTHYEETEHASEPDTAGMLELLDQNFKTDVTNIHRTLMNKIDNMQEQIVI